MMEDVLTTCDIEDGELSQSSDEVYNPLQRPTTLLPTNDSGNAKANTSSCSPLATCHQMQHALEDEDDDDTQSSSGDSTDDGIKVALGNMTQQSSCVEQRKRRKRVRRTVMVRVQANEQESQEKRARFKRYSVWTAALQEEALTENMRGIGVTGDDRNVESYDFRRRVNGTDNCLKRRLSNSTDDLSDSEMVVVAAKRGRPSSREEEIPYRRGVKSRLGHRSLETKGRRGSSATSGDSNNSYEPRHIKDIKDVLERNPLDVAREMARNLNEEKDELWLRIVDILGIELPMEVYEETRRIEAEGGMMVLNGQRRRTPGGVFLFLLKHNERLTPDQQKSIFIEERQKTCKWRKEIKSKSRDRKVEELKKRLSEKEKELTALNTRKELVLLGSELSLEQQAGNLSNPPPSPVGNEHSPEYKPHAINHVENDGTEPSTSASAIAAALAITTPLKQSELVSYEDDFLDVNCGEMDFF